MFLVANYIFIEEFQPQRLGYSFSDHRGFGYIAVCKKTSADKY